MTNTANSGDTANPAGLRRVGLKALAIRPGPGWKDLGCGVWEHSSKTRIHIGGSLVKLPNGTYIRANTWPEFRTLAGLVRINGGNRKRGLMAWARQMLCE